MDDKNISEILSALNQMEAEDRAEDAQRRGRAKLKVLIEGFVELKKSYPLLETKIAEAERRLSGLNAEYEGKRASKQKEIDKKIQGYMERELEYKTKGDDSGKKSAEVGAKLSTLEAKYTEEVAKWDKVITEKQTAFDKLERDLATLQRKHGLAATA